MIDKRRIGLLLFGAGLLMCESVLAETSVYAVVLGNNAPPTGSALAALRYADDDAIRYYRFFSHFTSNVYLLTVPDEKTQSRYPDIAVHAEIPSLENFEKVTAHIRQRIAADERQGKQTVFFLTFSGHGCHDENGVPFLVLHDGALTGNRLYGALSRLKSDYQHLFIDACYAEGVVEARGLFDRETDSRHVRLSEREVNEIVGAQAQAHSRFPGLGILISSSAQEKSHEWSRIESGIFTHEVLSGLSGPADVNLDGKIEYSELAAFISAANREVRDSRGKLTVIARPPARNRKVPIVDLRTASGIAYLTGNPSSLGHFVVELDNGERYAEANLSDMRNMHLIIPPDKKAFLSTQNGDAPLEADETQVVDVAELDFSKRQYSARGALDDAYQAGLFSARFSERYYLGFVDSSGFPAVTFDGRRLTLEKETTRDKFAHRKSAAIVNLTLSVSLAATAATLGGLALRSKKRFYAADLQVQAENSNNGYKRYSIGFWITASLVPITAMIAGLIWPRRSHRHDDKSAFRGRFHFDAAALEFRF